MSVTTDPAFLLPVAGILGVLVLGTHYREPPVVANAVGSLVLAALPTLLGVRLLIGAGTEPPVRISLSVWLAVAGLLHSYGMLGRYEDVWWWDHVTHTVSAALLAALLYGGLHHAQPPWLAAGGSAASGRTVGAVAVVLTLGLGFCWEFGELLWREVGERFDVQPVLEYYGPKDTALDVVFNGLAATGVVLLDPRLFGSVGSIDAGLARRVVLVGGALSVVGLVGTVALTVGPGLWADE